MQTDLNMSSAFERARELFTTNLQLLLAVAGVFFVIPQLLIGFISGSADGLPPGLDSSGSLEEVLEILNTFFLANFIWILLSALMTILGSLTILVIMLDHSRPTVGQAIGIAVAMFLAYFIMSLLIGLATGFGLVLLIIPGIYFAVKFSLAPSIMVAEKQTNPIDAMKSSWALTKGNSLRIFFYLLIIGVVLGVISLLVQGISGLLGVTIGLVVSSLFGGLVSIFNLAVAAGIYKELRGPMTEDLTDTFG